MLLSTIAGHLCQLLAWFYECSAKARKIMDPKVQFSTLMLRQSLPSFVDIRSLQKLIFRLQQAFRSHRIVRYCCLRRKGLNS